ncbi:uncharacterized protein LOC117342665 [Pecten maximus]|uniref:uncharacterized protein LOC117342665 n=1 Tax=Pecten maximus TaxID=6579 RepID=UPI0014588580|nr:uncharacterized protein LOC117342665 [Pecten maximus]
MEGSDDYATMDFNIQNVSDQVCVQPDLRPFHPSVAGFFYQVPDLICDNKLNWIAVENGTFWITPEAKKLYGEIKCQFAAVIRKQGNDNLTVTGKREAMTQDIMSAPSDFFKVSCLSANKTRYVNVHATVTYNSTKHKIEMKNTKMMGLNVLMLGFDSVSRMTWLRKLPKSRHYFRNILGGIELEGYNIVGDGTPQALLPLLTGMTESELPESRRGHPNATVVDGHPWIWKDFESAGYITQWAEDMAYIGTFNLRMMGFTHQPVHHYMRPYYLVAEKLYNHNKPYCLGSLPRHKIMLDWVRDSFMQYQQKLKFIFGFHSEYSHGNPNNLQWADVDLLSLLEFLNDHHYLNNTILIQMSDHGSRFADIRETFQGKLEERLPYFALRFPSWFKVKYQDIYENFLSNAKRLTTPFDIHETFHDILDLTRTDQINLSQISTRGISLFRPIPAERTCSEAGIEPHWCACLKWTEISVDFPHIIITVTKVIDFINKHTSHFRSRCSELYLLKIKDAFKFGIDHDVLKYKGSVDEDGRLPQFGDFKQNVNEIYQVTFVTIPGNGTFEASVNHTSSGEFVVNGRQISRINKYGHHADCIVELAPHLRPYCYCQ